MAKQRDLVIRFIESEKWAKVLSHPLTIVPVIHIIEVIFTIEWEHPHTFIYYYYYVLLIGTSFLIVPTANSFIFFICFVWGRETKKGVFSLHIVDAAKIQLLKFVCNRNTHNTLSMEAMETPNTNNCANSTAGYLLIMIIIV